jgi:hypothetical protein
LNYVGWREKKAFSKNLTPNTDICTSEGEAALDYNAAFYDLSQSLTMVLVLGRQR